MSTQLEMKAITAWCSAVIIGTLLPAPTYAQEVIWDRQYRLGNLVAFQSAYDATKYYYAGTRARLAREGGLPKFSFVRFVRRNPDGGDAIGGGIIHALVELGVAEEEVEAARDSLRDIDRNGTLVGPLAFTSGTFTLVSTTMNDETNAVARRVVGIGKAPLLEGDRAAVSLLLTEGGANMLWATFNTPTPDISFSFNMEIDAYRSPIQAKLVADWNKIYDHENFQAAVRAGIDSSSVQVMLGGEIDLTYDELSQSGAIQVTLIGEDESLERATEAAYSDLRRIMFTPANMSGDLSLMPEYREDAYTRATGMFDQAEANRRKREEDAQKRRSEAERAKAECASAKASQEVQPDGISRLENEATAAEQAAKSAQSELDTRTSEIAQSCTAEAEECNRIVAELTSSMRERVDRTKNAVDVARRRADEAATRERDGRARESGACSTAESLADAAEWEQGTQVTVSAYVAYRIKQVKQSGTFTQDMTKYKADTFSLRFDSNIGDMRRFLNDEDVFARVADDPLVYGQHDVYVDVSGIGATDFGDFLTSASIELRKEHQNGEVSRDSARLSKATLTDPAIRMAYVARGDTDADAFERYQFKIDWNYSGNVRIAGEWIDSTSDSIPVSPPLIKQPIQFLLDPSFVDELGIVGVTIRTYGVYGEQRGPGPVLVLQPDGGANGYAASGYILVDPYTGILDYTADLTLSTGETERIERRISSAIEVISRL